MKTKRSGFGADDAYISKWEYFSDLTFLFRAMNAPSNVRLDSIEVCILIMITLKIESSLVQKIIF